MIDPNVDINDLGAYGSIEDVWAAFPEGGQEGDYLFINNVLYRWDKWNLSWATDGAIVETTTKRLQRFEGEVDVYRDLHVGGDLDVNESLRVRGTVYATKVKQPNMGLFASLQALQKAYPKPEVGMWATVGSTIPSPIYRCDEAGTWTATGVVGGIDDVELNDYYTKQEAKALMDDYHQVITEEEYESLETKEDKLYFVIE